MGGPIKLGQKLRICGNKFSFLKFPLYWADPWTNLGRLSLKGLQNQTNLRLKGDNLDRGKVRGRFLDHLYTLNHNFEARF